MKINRCKRFIKLSPISNTSIVVFWYLWTDETNGVFSSGRRGTPGAKEWENRLRTLRASGPPNKVLNGVLCLPRV